MLLWGGWALNEGSRNLPESAEIYTQQNLVPAPITPWEHTEKEEDWMEKED